MVSASAAKPTLQLYQTVSLILTQRHSSITFSISGNFSIVTIVRHDYTNIQWEDLDGIKPQSRFKLRYVLILVLIIVVIGIIIATNGHHQKASDTQTPTSKKKATAKPHYHTIKLTIPPEESQ